MTKMIFKAAHRIAKELKREFNDIDYKSQVAINIKFLYEQKRNGNLEKYLKVEEKKEMDYKNFKIDNNNLHQIAHILLKELEERDENEDITVVTKTLSGEEKRMVAKVSNIRSGLNNPKMNDIALSSMEMRFE